jgi:ubiquinol-cytochrome c reductase iron-sulfur subunit
VSRFRQVAPFVALVISAVASVAAAVAYWADANTQWFGGILALALIAAGAGLVGWARAAMPDQTVVGEREPLESTPEEREAFVSALVEGERSITRRRVLTGSLLAIGGGLTATVLSMFRSLGPNPYPVLDHTTWTKGARLVTASGVPVKPADLGVGSVITVFPEGHRDDTSAQTLLIRVDPKFLKLPAGQEGWAYQGLVAYSKICTHAACPVGLYQQRQHLLLCPCHQSTFDVLDGAKPTSGPAARALPQLPIAVDKDGYLVAQSDYATPVGPGFWRRT